MKRLLTFTMILAGLATVAGGTEIYVSLEGNDRNPGTKDEPLRTLEGARDSIRAMRKKDGLPAGGVTVFLRGGVYPRTTTFELAKEDSGTATSPIV